MRHWNLQDFCYHIHSNKVQDKTKWSFRNKILIYSPAGKREMHIRQGYEGEDHIQMEEVFNFYVSGPYCICKNHLLSEDVEGVSSERLIQK